MRFLPRHLCSGSDIKQGFIQHLVELSMKKRKLIGFGQLTNEQVQYLMTQGVMLGGCYCLEKCRAQCLLHNDWSETIVVSGESCDLLEWADE